MSFFTDLFKKMTPVVAILDQQDATWYWLLCRVRGNQLEILKQVVNTEGHSALPEQVYELTQHAGKLALPWVLGVPDKQVVQSAFELPPRMSEDDIRSCIEQDIEHSTHMPIAQWQYDYRKDFNQWCPRMLSIQWAAVPGWVIEQTVDSLEALGQKAEGMYVLSQAAEVVIRRWLKTGDIKMTETALVHCQHGQAQYWWACHLGEIIPLNVQPSPSGGEKSIDALIAQLEVLCQENNVIKIDRLILAGGEESLAHHHWPWPVQWGNPLEKRLDQGTHQSSAWIFAIGLAWLYGATT